MSSVASTASFDKLSYFLGKQFSRQPATWKWKVIQLPVQRLNDLVSKNKTFNFTRSDEHDV